MDNVMKTSSIINDKIDNLWKKYKNESFLFKINFQKPDVGIMQKIWKLKLKGLSQAQYQELVRTYDFTGGQIDNIFAK